MQARFGPYRFDTGRHELSRGGERIELSPKAFALLEILVAARPGVVSRQELYERLWPATFVEDGNLHNLVSELRNALDDEGRTLIRTVHRVGYAFTGELAGTVGRTFAVVVGSKQIHLQDGENMIGRDPAAAVFISAPEVSRHHARIMVHGGGATLVDLGSKNGTHVGSSRVNGSVPLQTGDVIVVGLTTIRFCEVEMPSTVTAG